ncbi:hypothetical protein [Nocardia sp. NPDC024068]|uniref:hypothetical protein n=1 Tax=Nocardia sp. NPDC024068 TaxID=3157197 RepID=UPI0033C39B0C
MTVHTVKLARDQKRDPFDLIGLAVLNTGWYLLLGWAVAIHWALLFPVISAPIALALTAGVVFGWPIGLATGLAGGLLVAGFRRRFPDLFARWVTDRARSRFLTWWRYRRNWARRMKACRLTVTTDTGVQVPKLLAVGIGDCTDRVRLRMLEGQTPIGWANSAEAFAHAFRAEQAYAHIVGPATVELVVRRGDALADTVLLPRVDHWTKPKGEAA